MRRFLAARVDCLAACVMLMLFILVRPVGAQTWNDARSRALVEGATQRRAEQLADTALRDYQAVAHGYVAFLAQLGEGLRTPPKVIKTDELENEVYWRAPNLSKQRIVGRRDTLLLPTDIAYHTDHLGIVQNNFPDIIRIGDGGDEVADVPHPLSRVGLQEYDFALADSFSIGAGAQRIRVYEVKVRPKNDQLPRVVGAVYIDQASSQVVRLNLSFTRAAFLDKALEDLSLVLENRLVGGRFWLPSRQEIEIRRKGEWLEYPARGIIRGRWEIGDYRFNQELAPVLFAGPEIVVAPRQVLAQHKWAGNILDSLPPDVRAISEPEIARVQEEARALVRAQALATAKRATLSARRIEDFARFNRVEGLSLGGGLQKQLGAGWVASTRARYGIDDKQGKGAIELSHTSTSGTSVRLFGERDLRELGDVSERSSVINSIAAQEFGSDYSDPFLSRAVGARLDFAPIHDFDLRFTASYRIEDGAAVHARPVVGAFAPTLPVPQQHATVLSLEANRPSLPWIAGWDASLRGELRWRIPSRAALDPLLARDRQTLRALATATVARDWGTRRMMTTVSAAQLLGGRADLAMPMTEQVFLGGPVSAPGYDFHSLVSDRGATARVELGVPAPFPSFSLGRYGRVPARATLSPYVHMAAVGDRPLGCRPSSAPQPAVCPPNEHLFPALGLAYTLPFDLLRIDVARGLNRGRWTFAIDVSREFWGIL